MGNRMLEITPGRRRGPTLAAGCWRFGVLCLLLTATAIPSPAQEGQPFSKVKFTTLVNFDGSDGALPRASFAQGTDGDLYGTASAGGLNGDYGTVFKVSPGGTLTTLYNFCAQTNCIDGDSPMAGLVQGTDGSFYGTTIYGGTGDFCGLGCGTIFKVTPSGTLTTLHSFAGYPTDGSNPLAGMIQATDGNFYGTTIGGGTNGDGTVFKITPAGVFTVLYSFCSQPLCADGELPDSAVTQGPDGNFYGTVSSGGAYFYGTVFRMTPGGLLTTLYSFCPQFGCADGGSPSTGLVQGADGNFYGATSLGGASNACLDVGCGTVFRITPGGKLTTLHSFDGTDGNGPLSLAGASDGNFYGTVGGGPGLDGSAFQITPGGKLTTLHSFDGNDGADLYGGVVQDTSGNFYGTASVGGADGDGTVFSLAVGLRPFVETVPASGKVGAAVRILGSDLTGTTSVRFNGTAAVFKVVSKTLLSATVPPGATTGLVSVTVPDRTLRSNLKFQVMP